MLSFRPMRDVSVSRRQLLDFLRRLVPREHWSNFNENALKLENDQLINFGSDAEFGIKYVMGNCNGVLDFYGPGDMVLDDVKEIFGVFGTYSGQFNSSFPLTEAPKYDVFYGFVSMNLEIYDEFGCAPLGWNLVSVLRKSMCAKMKRMLAGTYEMISCSRLKQMNDDWREISLDDETKFQASSTGECSRWKDREPEIEFLSSEFADMLDDAKDSHLLSIIRQCLSAHLAAPDTPHSMETLYSVYQHINQLKLRTLSFLERHPYHFLPFVESEKILGDQFPVEPPVIRKLLLDDDKVLFLKDVEYAVRRALKNENRRAEIPEKLFKVDDDVKNGLYCTISHQDYLKLIEKLQLDPRSITLISTYVRRSRHMTAPIPSPYGTDCKPAVDVFYELMNILTIEFQIWSRIRPGQVTTLAAKIEKVCAKFMDSTKPRYFLDCSRIEQLEEQVRKEVKSLLANLSKTPGIREKRPDFIEDSSGLFTSEFLRKIVEKFNPERIFSKPTKHLSIIFAKRVTGSSSRLSQLDVLMLVQECLAGCLVKQMSLVNKFLCSQKHCQPFTTYPCVCPKRKAEGENRESYAPALFPFDFYEVKSHTLDVTGKVMRSLVNKRTGKEFVRNDAPQEYLVSRLVAGVSNLAFRDGFIKGRSESSPSVHEQFRTRCLLTFDEMNQLIDGSVGTYVEFIHETVQVCAEVLNSEKREQVMIKVGVALPSEHTERSSNIIDCTVSNAALNDRLPNRIFYLPVAQNFLNGKMSVDSGELFQVMRILLIENSSMMSREHWAAFNRSVVASIAVNGWLLKSVEDAMELLNKFPINPGRFYFVPNIDKVFTISPLNVPSSTPIASESVATVIPSEHKSDDKEQQCPEAIDVVDENVSAKGRTEEKKLVVDAEESENACVEDRVAELLKKTQELEKMSKLVKKLEKKEVAGKKKLQEMKDRIAKEEKELGEMSGIVETLKKSEKEGKENIMKLNDQIVEKDKEFQEFRQKASTKDREIKLLRDQLKAETAKYTERSDERQNKVRALQAKDKQQTEKINELQSENESLKRELEEQRGQLELRESALLPSPSDLLPGTPSSSGSPSATVSEVFSWQKPVHSPKPCTSAVSFDPPPQECGICLNKMGSRSKTTTCGVCSTKWHTSCIEQWVKQKSTCPVCSRSLPSPSDFPPLQ